MPGYKIKPMSDLLGEWDEAQQTEPPWPGLYYINDSLTSWHILISFLVRPWFSFFSFAFHEISNGRYFPHTIVLYYDIKFYPKSSWHHSFYLVPIFLPKISFLKPSFLLCQSRMLSRPSEQLLSHLFIIILGLAQFFFSWSSVCLFFPPLFFT